MNAQKIYYELNEIVKPIHAHDDQIIAIAKWMESELINTKNKLNLKTELRFLYKYSERIGLDAESRIEEILKELPD
jgi:hypothetical protein